MKPLEEKAKLACMTPLDMVRSYYATAGVEPNEDTSLSLIFEEYDEWYESYHTGSDEDELKELADLVYVIYGYANARGWNLDEALRRVHKSNMGRMKQNDGSIKYRSDGKIIKNPDAPKCDLSDLV